MINGHANKAVVSLLIAGASLAGLYLGVGKAAPGESSPIALALYGLFVITWFLTFIFFVKAKGYTVLLSLLALLGPLGILVLLLLPDKTQGI